MKTDISIGSAGESIKHDFSLTLMGLVLKHRNLTSRMDSYSQDDPNSFQSSEFGPGRYRGPWTEGEHSQKSVSQAIGYSMLFRDVNQFNIQYGSLMRAERFSLVAWLRGPANSEICHDH